MKKNILHSPALALALAFITPVFFVFSQNWHMLDPRAMLAASGITVLLACTVFLIASTGIRLWKKISANAPRRLQWLVAAGFLAILVETCCFFLQTQFFAAIPDPRWLRILLTRILPFIVLLALARKCGIFPINLFLAVFLGISSINMGVLLLTEEQAVPENQYLAAYELKNRPNIYLFFLESYHTLDVQRDVYGIDTRGFENYLTKNNFVDYGKIYSNSPSTLLSLSDTFLLHSYKEYARGNSDAAYAVRRVLGGSKDNTLLRTLKTNGYTTVFLVGSGGYYGTLKGEFLDDSDGLTLIAFNALVSDTCAAFRMLNSRFGNRRSILYLDRHISLLYTALKRSEQTPNRYTGSLENRVSQAVAAHRHPSAPLFLAFKGGAEHTPSDSSYTWRQHEDFVQSGTYQTSVRAGTRELQQICDKIIAEDPGSMIIIIGDHGAWRFRNAANGYTSPADLIEELKAKNISFQAGVDDRFAVFLAIRLPYGQPEDISRGLPMSHVNLFRHVFAHLNADAGILETREPSESYWGKVLVVKEGKIATEQ